MNRIRQFFDRKFDERRCVLNFILVVCMFITSLLDVSSCTLALIIGSVLVLCFPAFKRDNVIDDFPYNMIMLGIVFFGTLIIRSVVMLGTGYILVAIVPNVTIFSAMVVCLLATTIAMSLIGRELLEVADFLTGRYRKLATWAAEKTW